MGPRSAPGWDPLGGRVNALRDPVWARTRKHEPRQVTDFGEFQGLPEGEASRGPRTVTDLGQ
eukprot:8157142-Pyramimonas_sp.AAC.1